MYSNLSISELMGKTITEINQTEDEVVFKCSDGTSYKMFHDQDCCESVTVEDVIGDINDLLNSPITLAEESTSDTNPEGVNPECPDESFTWTFYRLATIKGYVTIRWFGTSNGYYSESVDFIEIT